jgi:hypothetical protein
MLGVVISPELRKKLEFWNARERRNSVSQLCSLLLEYAVARLEQAGSTMALLAEVEESERSSSSSPFRGAGTLREEAEHLISTQENALHAMNKQKKAPDSKPKRCHPADEQKRS